MSELKLLNCPFCGGEAEMLNYSPTEWLVHCIECDGMVENWRKTEQEAIEQWNRRTPMANIVEKLEEREKYLENAMKESHGNGHRFSEEKAMNERVAIRYAINIVKQEMGVMNNEPTNN